MKIIARGYTVNVRTLLLGVLENAGRETLYKKKRSLNKLPLFSL